MPDIALRDIVTFLTAAGLIGGLVIAWVRWQLSGDFARRGDVSDLAGRVEKMERTLALAPTHADLREINARLGATERGVAVANAQIEAARDQLARVESGMRLVTEHLLKDPK